MVWQTREMAMSTYRTFQVVITQCVFVGFHTSVDLTLGVRCQGDGRVAYLLALTQATR